MGESMNEKVNVNWPAIIVSWAWAALPLAWGVIQTIHKAAALFQN